MNAPRTVRSDATKETVACRGRLDFQYRGSKVLEDFVVVWIALGQQLDAGVSIFSEPVVLDLGRQVVDRDFLRIERPTQPVE